VSRTIQQVERPVPLPVGKIKFEHAVKFEHTDGVPRIDAGHPTALTARGVPAHPYSEIDVTGRHYHPVHGIVTLAQKRRFPSRFGLATNVLRH